MVVAGRLVVGGGTLIAPQTAGRVIGISSAANPALPYVARLFGGRAVLMAVLVASARGVDQDRQLRAGVVIDIADALAALAALRGGQLAQRAGIAAFAAAATEACLGVASVGGLSAGRARSRR
jgi:hypothetical protein